jgi:hypothetical protein
LKKFFLPIDTNPFCVYTVRNHQPIYPLHPPTSLGGEDYVDCIYPFILIDTFSS